MNDAVRFCTEWNGCYDGGWNGEIVPEAFTHPAKVSRALIRHIYAHALEEGWLQAGDVVVDPFGGIAGTALDAMWNGLTWFGCELEPRFVGLAGENIALWSRRYGAKPGFGAARILQGDSRKLSSVIATADLVCSSPPYAKGLGNGGGLRSDVPPSGDVRYGEAMRLRYGNAPGQLENMREGTAPALICSSPPYAAIATGAGGLNTKPGDTGQQTGRSAAAPSQTADQRYGESAGQLATMREGEAPACVIGSRPFSGTEQPCASQTCAMKDYHAFTRGDGTKRDETHISNPANLSAMPEGRFDAVGGSPPFEASMSNKPSAQILAGSGGRMGESCKGETYYGTTEGQVGAVTGDTFWQAAREIVAQCHQILRPGGHAIWICKDFVRKGRRVPFSDQWQALCEQEGFRLVCRHRAMLVARHGEQDTIFGDTQQITTQRKSFFRRLAEKKGSPAIDWEDVICVERP